MIDWINNVEFIGLFEAKPQLSALVELVARGEAIALTKARTYLVRLMPMEASAKKDPRQVAEAIRALRKGVTFNGVTVRELIGGRRRF